MSTKYKNFDEVPNKVLCKRLEELSDAVTKGRDSINREFTMRVPAEHDRDPDLVLSAAAKRIEDYERKSEEFLLWFNNNTYKNRLETHFLIELGNYVSSLRDINCG